MSKDISGKSLAGLVCLGITLGIAVAFTGFTYSNKPVTPKSIDATLVAKNTQALNKCLKDKPNCVGGYIKWLGGPVVRIANTTGIYSNFEVSMDSIEIKMSLENPWFPSAIDWVALPNSAAWNNAAQEYGRQFTLYKE